MHSTSLDKLTVLQKNPRGIRNICILAHVDHGKTTLADTLVASNGIISKRMAGKLRYMDSRADEQLRGITMKSSAISLHYNMDMSDYLINLIDSPGHIDFSSEVSTAVRLCDGAIVLVDVVEGVCPQTHAVLRQAWLENIKPVLILNKVDRLISELRMSPLEAYIHLQQLLEQVNAVMGELFASHHLEHTSNQKLLPPSSPTPAPLVTEQTSDHVYDWSTGLEDTDDSTLYFSPHQANVIFASAVDGWGFGIQHFAKLYSAKLGFKAEVLNKTLWGDFYIDTKTKRIKKGAQARGKKPLFVQFILDNLWAVYDAVLLNRDKDKIDKIVTSMKLQIQARDIRHNDPRMHLQAITTQWLPLSEAVLSMVVQCLPSPIDVSEERVEKLICSNAQRFDSLPTQTQQLKSDFLSCSPEPEAPVIVYISKMFTVDWKSVPQNKQRRMTDEEMVRRRQMALERHAKKMVTFSEPTVTVQLPPPPTDPPDGPTHQPDEPTHQPDEQVFIAFARVFSGTVRRGAKLYILGPKHDPALALEDLEESEGDESMLSDCYITPFTVSDLYMFMGKELEAMDEVPAGNLLGLGGLGDEVLKSATLSSTVACPAFTDMYFEASPIVRVALEPAHPGDIKRLREGLRLLNQADPCVRVLIQSTGEHVIMAAGEVHLQKCLDDLRDKYAKVEVIVSPPLVPFRETIIIPPTMDNVNEAIEAPSTRQAPTRQVPARPPPTRAPPVERDEEVEEDVAVAGVLETKTANRLCSIRVRAEPLPEGVTQLLEDHATLLLTLDLFINAKTDQSQLRTGSRINPATLKSLQDFRDKLEAEFEKSGDLWKGALDNIWSFGPKKNGPNMLLNLVPEYSRPSIWSCINSDQKATGLKKLWDFDNSIVSGFQMATLAGPLCEEPMRGVAFFLEKWETDEELRMKERKISERERKASEGSGRERRVSERVRTISGMFGDDPEEQSLDTWHNKSTDLNISQQQISQPESTSISQNGEILTENQSDCSTEKVTDLSSSDITIDTTCDKMVKLSVTEDSNTETIVKRQALDSHQKEARRFGPFSGQLMSCMKDACRRAFVSQPQRLMVAMYSCVIQATAEVLGKLYGVLGKRHGRILYEEMREGSSYFNISAVLPVIESFGFAEEIRKKTSGLASPQLKFSHWEVLDMDPFWVPTTEEEYLHYGEKADSENQARQYMNTIRRRKGLKVQEKLVEFAEKQRTLSRNK